MPNYKITTFDFPNTRSYFIKNRLNKEIASVIVEINNDYNYISELYVNSEYRKLGLATQLLSKIISDYPHTKLRLWCLPDEDERNPISFSILKYFYESFGFKEISPSSDNCIMEKN